MFAARYLRQVSSRLSVQEMAGILKLRGRIGAIVTRTGFSRPANLGHQRLKLDYLLIFAMCGMLWLCIGFVLYQQRASLLRDAMHDTANISRAFEENTKRTVDGIDRTLLFFRTEYAANPKHFNLVAWQRSTQALDDLIFQLAVIDRAGQLTASSLGPVRPGVDLSDREHFRVQAQSKQDKFFVSKPVMGRESGKWSIQFTRKIFGADGEFEGVGVISLDPFNLSKFYGSLDIGGGSVVLFGLDGIVRAGAPINADMLGQNLSGSPLLAAAQVATTGTLKRVQVGDTTQLLSFRRLDQYGLVVAVGVVRSEVLGSFTINMVEYLIAGTLITIVILLIGRSVIRRNLVLAGIREMLAKSQEVLTDTLENMSQGIFMVDTDNRVAVINHQAVKLLGIPDNLARIGMSFDEMVDWQVRNDGLDTGQAGALLDRSSGPQDLSNIYERTRPNGMTIEVRTRRLGDNRAVRTFTDITERKQAEAQVVYLAHHDALTGLGNRTYFHDRLSHVFALSDRKSAGFALLCLDLDRFKQINDARGHDVGDRLLQIVADRLCANLRESDTVARFGGDEFAVLQVNIEQPSAAADLGERLVACLTEPYEIGGILLTIGVSIGIAVHPEDGRTAEHLLKSADIALYKAKEDGRGRVCFFEPEMDRKLQEQLALERDLREVIADERLELDFQPICDVSSGRLLAYEALARWPSPNRGSISPAVFIPVAEDTGLIGDLGRWVLRAACREAATWPRDVQLTVNLSPLQLLDPDFDKQLLHILSETGLSPSRLGLEVTERALICDSEQTLATMHSLRSQGVCFYLDDFGAGHAGLSYLIRFPFDCIKVDRSFTERLETDRAAEAVIRATIFLGEFLHIDVVVEGVETKRQLGLLGELGCRRVQGNLISRPKPASELDGDSPWSGYVQDSETTR